MTNRVAFIFYSAKQHRTFIESNFLEELEKFVDIDLFIYGNRVTLKSVEKSDWGYLPSIGNLLERMGTLLSSAKLWKTRNRSRSHYFRAICSFAPSRIRKANTTMILYSMSGWSEWKRRFVRLLGDLPFLLQFLFSVRNLVVVRTIAANFRKISFNHEDYSYILIPFSGLLSSEFDDLINFFQSRSVKTVAVQENWDNLSSKTFINSNPDFFLVWGRQSLGHLKSIHSLDDTTGFVIGSPRFAHYQLQKMLTSSNDISLLSLERYPASLNLPYVLFTGTGDGIDDEFILKETAHIILESHRQVNLVYRPHPFTRNPISKELEFQLRNLGVLIDSSSHSKSVFYHCPLIANASLVINQFSTMLLEALSCNIKVLLPTFVCRPVKYDYTNAVDEWHHFMGLKSLPNVFVSESQDNYKKDLEHALTSKSERSDIYVSWMVDQQLSKSLLYEFHKQFLENT